MHIKLCPKIPNIPIRDIFSCLNRQRKKTQEKRYPYSKKKTLLHTRMVHPSISFYTPQEKQQKVDADSRATTEILDETESPGKKDVVPSEVRRFP